MTITKADISSSVHNRVDLARNRAIDLVESLIEIIKSTLSNGEDVLISGFGKFSVKEKGERRGRNPQTGEDLVLAPRKVVTFQCSGVLRSKINNNH